MTEKTQKQPTTAKVGRPGVTYEQYLEAYEALSDQNAPGSPPPTLRQIRRYLGTGSNTTLTAHKLQMGEERVAKQLPPLDNTPELELLTLVSEVMRKLTVEAAQVADDRVDEIEAQANSHVTRSTAIADKAQANRALLEHRAKQAETELVQARKLNTELQRRVDTANASISGLELEKKTLQNERAVDQASIEQGQHNVGAALKERDRSIAVADKLQQQILLAEENSATLIAQTETHHDQWREDLKAEKTRSAEILKRLQACEGQLANVGAERDSLLNVEKQFTKKLNDLALEAVDLNRQLDIARNRYEAVRQQLNDKDLSLLQAQEAMSKLLEKIHTN